MCSKQIQTAINIQTHCVNTDKILRADLNPRKTTEFLYVEDSKENFNIKVEVIEKEIDPFVTETTERPLKNSNDKNQLDDFQFDDIPTDDDDPPSPDITTINKFTKENIELEKRMVVLLTRLKHIPKETQNVEPPKPPKRRRWKKIFNNSNEPPKPKQKRISKKTKLEDLYTFSCQYCGKFYKTAASRTLHEKNHILGKQRVIMKKDMICDMCGLEFMRPTLICHLMKHLNIT